MTLGFILSFCSDHPTTKKSVLKQIDSILHYDTIVAIYSHGDPPPIISDDAIEEGDSHPQLYMDSINRWTNSKLLIDSLYTLFPFASKYLGVIETVCCGHREILVQTSKHKYRFSWNINTSDSAVFIDTIPFRMDKNALNTIYNLLDRKIITKEIPSKDSILYPVIDIYNTEYKRPGAETQLIYILK